MQGCFGGTPEIPDREHLYWTLYDIKNQPLQDLISLQLESQHFPVPSANVLNKRVDRAMEYVALVANDMSLDTILDPYKGGMPSGQPWVCQGESAGPTCPKVTL